MTPIIAQLCVFMLGIFVTATGIRVSVNPEIEARRIRPLVNFSIPNKIMVAINEFTNRIVKIFFAGLVVTKIRIIE